MSESIQAYGVMPSGERQAIPDRYKIQDDSAHVKVRDLSAYDFVLHTYEGSNGYRDGTYLIPHPREQFYENRRETSYFVNAFAPIINAMVLPVFNQEIQRTCSNDLYDDFIENCDSAGTPLADFLEVCITHARLFGVTFIVMDNFDEFPQTIPETIDDRKYPYVYERMPQDIVSRETDRWGKLRSITFFERCEKIDGVERKLFRYWDAMAWRLYYEVKSSSGEPTTITISEGTHGLGVLPVIPIMGFSNTNSMRQLPNPPTYDLAMLTFALFNKESQVVTLEQFQAFSILCTSDYDQTSLSAGPTTFLNCGPNSKFPPQYASPNTDNIRVMVANCERLKEEIYKQAGQKGVIGIKTETSGVAKEWDFRAEEAVLKKTAKVSEETEEAIADLFAQYIGRDVGLEVVYPNSFSPTFETQRIDNSIKILRETPPEEIVSELWNEIVVAFWSHDKEKARFIIDEIEAGESGPEGTELPEDESDSSIPDADEINKMTAVENDSAK